MRAEVKAGADPIILGEPISSPTVISPKHLEQLSLPNIRKVTHEAGGRVPFILHICGDATRIIDNMVETGTRYLEVDSMVDLAPIRRKHGN